MSTFLDQILKAKGEELSSSRYRTPLSELKSRCRDMESPRPFQKAITSGKKGGEIRLIAEIKKASPSKGVLAPVFGPVGLARIYEEHGAAALSILTERFFFLGDPDYLRSAR
ncbi:MAG: indole-3-glycerol-phosphate synthase TrpC, partial [Nitrospirae bacterium]|nr:indole-3-glycerol-phosphate synthase TrpC [Nitrospirota bacterium]